MLPSQTVSTIYREPKTVFSQRCCLKQSSQLGLDESCLERKNLLPTPVEVICSLEMCLIVNESGCTTVKLTCWSDKWMRLAFCAFLADFNCSFGWSEYNFLSKVDNESLLLLLLFPWKIYLHFLSPLHIHLWFLSYFSKCNYPARLNYGKEITKIFSCQKSESGQHILGGLNVEYSFYLSIISSFPTSAPRTL